DGPGIEFDGSHGDTSGVIGQAVVERARGAGIVAYGAGRPVELEINQTNVRGTLPRHGGDPGYGIALNASGSSLIAEAGWSAASKPTRAHLSKVLVEGSSGAGILVEGSFATITSTVVRGTAADREGRGRGVEVRRRSAGELPAELTLVGSSIESSHDAGV